MKIFYKKDYKLKVIECEKLKEIIKRKELAIAKFADNLNYREEQIKREIKANAELQNELLKSSEDLKKVLGAKGGLTKENNRLKNQIEELKNEISDLKKQLEESMTDKYLVKKNT